MTEAAVARSRGLGRMPVVVARLGTAAVAWPLAVGAVCFTLTAVRSSVTLDGYLDLVCGRLIVGHGIPHVDLVSAAGNGRPWIDQQWLAQLLMYGTWRVFGYAGVKLLFALLLGAAYALLARLCVQLGAPPQRAMSWALLAFLGTLGYAAVRAEMFSYPAFLLVLTLLANDARSDRPGRSFLWLFVVLALWANLHGAVMLGIVLAVLYCGARVGLALRRADRRLALLYAGSAGICVTCLFATPYGFSGIRYYRGIFSSSILGQYENEWTSPQLTSVFNWMTFLFAIAIVGVGVLAARRRHLPNPALVLAAVVTGALAFDAVRYQPWLSISAAALSAVTLGSLRPLPPAMSPRVLRLGATGLAGFALVAGVSAARAPQVRSEVGLDRGALAAAARWSEGHPRADILADVSSSDRLLWSYPATIGRVALDARLDFYEAADVRAWFGYVFGRRVPRTIGGSPVGVYVASSESRLLYRKLLDGRCLRTLHADSFGIAAVRDESSAACRTARRP